MAVQGSGRGDGATGVPSPSGGAALRPPDASRNNPPLPPYASETPIDTARRRGRRLFLGGLILGLLIGFFALLIVAAALSQPTIFRPVGPGSDPDMWVSINARYLNDVAQQQIEAAPIDIVVGKITGLQLGLADANAGMTLTPTFDLNLITIAPSVDVQLDVTDGKISGHLTGEPRLGNISVPLNVLPFDLGKTIRDGTDQVINDVLLYQLNESFRAGFGTDKFDVTQISTSSEYLVVKLRRQR